MQDTGYRIQDIMSIIILYTRYDINRICSLSVKGVAVLMVRIVSKVLFLTNYFISIELDTKNHWIKILYTGKNFSRFIISPFRPIVSGRI